MWFVLSLFFGVSLALRNLLSKVSSSDLPELVSMTFLFVFSLPVVIWGVFFQPIVITDSSFWILILIRFFLDFGALFAFYKALKVESVSVVIPLLALQPVLTVGTTFLINQQQASLLGLFATVLVGLGLSLLFVNESKAGEKKDFLKAASLVLLTVVLYSFLEPLHAKAISFSNVSTYLIISQLLFSVVLVAASLSKWPSLVASTLKSKKLMLTNVSMGVVFGLELAFLFLAFSLAPNVAYVISISNLQLVITTLGAVLFLKESFSWRKGVAITLVTFASILFAFA